MPTRRRLLESRTCLWAVVLFAVGFGTVRALAPARGLDRGGPPVAREPARPVLDEAAREAAIERAAPVTPARADPAEPSTPPGAVLKSRLPEWMRFRYEHPRAALATEMAVRIALDDPVAMIDVVNGCAAKEGVDAEHRLAFDFDLSAQVELEGREAAVHGWGCDAQGDAAVAGRICDCLLARVPEELHVSVPEEVKDAELAPYSGLLSTRF